jgi:hypothetical protein
MALNPILAKKRTTENNIELTENDWARIETLVCVLAPIFVATDALGGSKYPTLVIVFFHLKAISQNYGMCRVKSGELVDE